MATRHLRKLQQQLAAQQADAPAARSSDEESEDESEGDTRAAPFNPFDLLTDDDDAGPAPSDEEEDSDEFKEKEQAAAATKQQQQQQGAGGGGAKKKKNKKKKGKATGGGGGAAEEAGDSTTKAPTAAKGGGGDGKKGGVKDPKAAAKQTAGTRDDDIDAILKELNIAAPSASTSGSKGTVSSGRKAVGAAGGAGGGTGSALLGIDAKRLRGDDELRRIFGAAVIEAVDREDAAEAGRGGPGGVRRYGWAPRNMPRRRPMKRGLLVAPRDDWPYYEPGTLLMEPAGTAADGTPMFKYVWPPTYRGAQALFEQAQGSYDPNAVAAVLHSVPYHVDSLLAMADLYRAMGEGQYAEESLNRALYALEAAWCPGFDPATARCRLDIELPENRALFVALFRHAQALSRRGCHSSALEVSKLLLALDPQDPLGALQLVDYLALRAGRYSWLERFVEGFDGGAALALLPNFAYSRALARFWQEKQWAAGGASTSTAAGEDGGDGDTDSGAAPAQSAHDTLVSAMLLHPLVVPQMMARLQGQGVGKDAYWQSLMARKLFVGAGSGGSATLEHLVALFVERSHLLWKAQDVQGWMRRAADAAADIADGKTATSTSDSSVPALGAADWAAVAREAFPAGDGNDFSHLRVADFSDAVNALPREEVAAAMEAGGDIGAIEDEVLAAQLQEVARQQAAAAAGTQRVSEEELRGANPLMVLLRSLLPWVDAGQAPDYGAEDDGAPGAGGGQHGGA